MSVGEWLTRRILRGLTESSEADYRSGGDEARSRDTEEMLARVSRSESETNNAYRRIEEQLRNLARRLEDSERTQNENSRAMNRAAGEINIAAREQAEAFDQLGAHVVKLGDRVARVERGSASDSLKDAVKGLHAGLSRLADQIGQSSNHSATQISILAGNVESVAQKINGIRSEAEIATHALAARVSAFEERMRSAEDTAQATVEKLEKTMEGVEAAQSSARDAQAENQKQALLIAQSNEALDNIQARITASEARIAGALAHVEEQIARTDVRQDDTLAGRKLQSIEHALTDVAGRLERAERAVTNATRTIDEDLRNVSARLDAAEKRHHDAFAELHAAAQPAAPAPSSPAADVSPSPSKPASADDPDLPPFPERRPPATQAKSDDLRKPNGTALAEEIRTAASAAPDSAAASNTASTAPSQPQPAELADSYIAAAQRSAREAAAEGELGPRGPLDAFSWSATPIAPTEEIPPKSSASRFLVAAVIVIMATSAIVAGILLSRSFVQNGSAVFSFPVLPAHTVSLPSFTAKAATAEPAALPPSAEQAETRAAKPLSSPMHIPRKKIETARVAFPAAPIDPQPASFVAPVSTMPVQPVSAMDRLAELATSGNADAELLIGLKYLDGDGVPVNEAEAAKWLERASDQGEAVALYRLGTLYERGHGVPANAAKAVQYYATAAKLGNRKAMHNLAVAYADGAGTQKDLAQAAQWFSKAAELGLADSQFNLAVLFERGMGVQQSLIDAYKWYAIAATQGDTESKVRLDAISTQMSSDDRAAAQKAAADFHPERLDRKANAPPGLSVVD